MTPTLAYSLVVDPVLKWLGPPYDSPDARLMLMAIAIQEGRNPGTGMLVRAQEGGPARGFWQFELAGIAGVTTKSYVRAWLNMLGVGHDSASLHMALGCGADEIACALARGLLWTDPNPLPTRGDTMHAYGYYVDCWKPGKPSRTRWATSYADALTIVAP